MRSASTPPQPAPSEASHKLMGRLLRDYIRPHIGRLALAALMMIVVAITVPAQAWLLQPAIDEIFVSQNAQALLWVPLAVIAVAVARGLATYGQSILMNGVGQRIIADTQVEMYGHLIRADLAYLEKIHSGTLVSSFLYDVNLLRDAVGRAVTGIAKDSITLIGLAAVMFWQDWQLAIVVVFVFPLAGVLIRRFGKRMRKASTATQQRTGELSTHLTETLKGVRLVKAYGMETGETARARDRVEARLKPIMQQIRIRSASTPFIEALGGLAIAAAIFYGGWRGQTGELTLGAFMSFLAALLMAYQPVKSLASLNVALQEGLAAAQRIFAVLDVSPRIIDRPGAQTLERARGELALRDVSFAYGDGTPALHDIDLAVPQGGTVALVGPSGAGKSTLMNLIPRFHDASAGQVLLDGIDVRDLTLASLRQSVALVSQEVTLFDDTVRANIAYGSPQANLEQVEAAAQAAAAHGFISELPQGYDTIVGENGVKLSGGQRQRIAIARAMLKDAPVLLLDEATSALDTEAERKVQEALERLMQGRTTLVIAHRLSTIVAADRICYMEGGRIVESGSHAELMARKGRYARLYGLQFAGAGDDKARIAGLNG